MFEALIMTSVKASTKQLAIFKDSDRFILSDDKRTAVHYNNFYDWSQLLLNTRVAFNSGKYFVEFLIEGLATYADGVQIGISIGPNSDASGFGSDNPNVHTYVSNGSKREYSYFPYGEAFDIGDLVGVSLDTNTREMRAYKNGVDQGVLAIQVNDAPDYKVGYYIYQLSNPYTGKVTIPPTSENIPPGFQPWPL